MKSRVVQQAARGDLGAQPGVDAVPERHQEERHVGDHQDDRQHRLQQSIQELFRGLEKSGVDTSDARESWRMGSSPDAGPAVAAHPATACRAPTEQEVKYKSKEPTEDRLPRCVRAPTEQDVKYKIKEPTEDRLPLCVRAPTEQELKYKNKESTEQEVKYKQQLDKLFRDAGFPHPTEAQGKALQDQMTSARSAALQAQRSTASVVAGVPSSTPTWPAHMVRERRSKRRS